MRPRFPFLPWLLFQVCVGCLCVLLPFAATNLILLWPVGIAIAHVLLTVVVFSWAATATATYYDERSLHEHEQRRINPLALHIHE